MLNALAQKSTYERVVEDGLSFTGTPLIQGRHKIHPYPAMLHPCVVNQLLSEYATSGNIVFDPFCGSGVVPVQASINGYKSIGFDINPMALLIAKTKLTRYDTDYLHKEATALIQKAQKSKKTDIPEITNIDYWYEENIKIDLGKIRHGLMNENYKYFDFLLVVFALICRDQSFQRKGEFKRYRRKEDDIIDLKNEVFTKFLNHVDKMIEIFYSTPTPSKDCDLRLFNSENEISEKTAFDIVITSPPYGDSRTTVAYGQFSSFGIDWIKDLNPFGSTTSGEIDRLGLGAKGEINENLFKYDALQDVLNLIRAQDEARAQDVLYFFNGYYNSIKNTVSRLRDGGRVCYVVGNRTVKGYKIPMDQITAAILEDVGLVFNGILVRQISSKVMPLRNSPANVTGITSNTMTEEYVVLFKK